MSTAVRQNLLSRADYLLLQRSAHDMRRVPLFALILLVLGEYTPLVLYFATGLVPLTCRVPAQVLAARRKMEERRARSFREVGSVGSGWAEAGAKAGGGGGGTGGGDAPLEALRPAQILHISRSLGLHASLWPELSLGGGAHVPPLALLRHRLRRRAEHLDLDDYLIERDGGVAELEMEEVRMALVERGLDVLGRSDVQLRAALRRWLEARGVVREVWGLFLTR